MVKVIIGTVNPEIKDRPGNGHDYELAW